MTRFVFPAALLFVGTISPTAVAQENADKAKELERLQGTWKLVALEQAGKNVRYQDAQTYTIDRNKMIVKQKGHVIAEGLIELDPTKSPKHLDVPLNGATHLTIYIRVGDYLVQCGDQFGKSRPTVFTTTTTNGGNYLMVLERQK